MNSTSPTQTLLQESIAKRSISESRCLDHNPLSDADALAAITHVKASPDYSSYHFLLVIRRFFPNLYNKIDDTTKARVLCSALQNSTWLNDWGYLAPDGSCDDEAAAALVEIGRPAIRFLVPVLDDDSDAPLYGSEAATLSSIYKYRRKDFAYRYLSLIRGNVPIFDIGTDARDKHIKILRDDVHGS